VSFLKPNIPKANAPHIRQITGYGWRFILNVKPDSHASLEKQFAGHRANGQVQEWSFTDDQGVRHYFAWTKELCLSESAIDVKINYLLYEQTDKKGQTTRWTWITNLCSMSTSTWRPRATAYRAIPLECDRLKLNAPRF
jgi:hypothetical protein